MQSLVKNIIKQVEDAAREACKPYIGFNTDNCLENITNAVKNQVDHFFADDETIIIDKNEIQFKYSKDNSVVPANLYTALLMQGIFVHKNRIKNGQYESFHGTKYCLENDELIMTMPTPLKFIKVDVVVKKQI